MRGKIVEGVLVVGSFGINLSEVVSINFDAPSGSFDCPGVLCQLKFPAKPFTDRDNKGEISIISFDETSVLFLGDRASAVRFAFGVPTASSKQKES